MILSWLERWDIIAAVIRCKVRRVVEFGIANTWFRSTLVFNGSVLGVDPRDLCVTPFRRD